MPDVYTPLGFISGTVTVEGLPKALPNDNIVIIAGAKGESHGAETVVQPSVNGSNYSIPLAPGKYKVFASFGSAKSPNQDADVTNGKATEVNFCFGRDAK